MDCQDQPFQFGVEVSSGVLLRSCQIERTVGVGNGEGCHTGGNACGRRRMPVEGAKTGSRIQYPWNGLPIRSLIRGPSMQKPSVVGTTYDPSPALELEAH